MGILFIISVFPLGMTKVGYAASLNSIMVEVNTYGTDIPTDNNNYFRRKHEHDYQLALNEMAEAYRKKDPEAYKKAHESAKHSWRAWRAGEVGLEFPHEFNPPEPSSFYNNAMAKYAGGGACWFCPIFQVIFVSIGRVSESLAVQMSWKLVQLMGAMLLFVILFKVGKMLLRLQPQHIENFMDDFIKPIGAVMIASSLLLVGMPDKVDETAEGSTNVYSYLLIPMMDASFAISDMILDSTEQNAYSAVEVQRSGSGTTVSESKCAAGAVAAGVFSEEMDGRFLCWLRSLSSSLMRGIVIGQAFVFGAFDVSFDDLWSFFWDEGKFYARLLMFVGGLIMVISYFIVFISFPFKIIDTLLRLGFVLALTPLWVCFWAFKSLRSYTKTAMNIFVSSCLFFVFMGIIVSFVIHLMNTSLAGDQMLRVTEHLSRNEFNDAALALNFTGQRFFIIICCGIISWSVIGTASSLATSFGGGAANLTVGDSTATFVSKYTASTISKTAKLSLFVQNQAGAAYQGASRRIRDWALRRSQRASEQRRWHPAEYGGVGEELFKASTTAEQGTFTILKNGTVIQRTEQGAISYTKTADGRREVKTFTEKGLASREVFDETAKKSIIYDANGAIIGTRLYGANGSYIQRNSDGTIIMQANGLETKRDADGKIISQQRWGTKRDENGQEVIDKSHRITEIQNEDGSMTFINEIGDEVPVKTSDGAEAVPQFRVRERTTATRSKDGKNGPIRTEKFKLDAKGNYTSRRTEENGQVISERLYDQGGYKDIFFSNGRAEKLRDGDSHTMFGQKRRNK